MLTTVDRDMRSEKWFVATAWSPHWMFGKYKLRYIDDPKGSLGAAEHVDVLARKGFKEDSPAAAAFLSRMKLPLDELEAAMFDGLVRLRGRRRFEQSAAIPQQRIQLAGQTGLKRLEPAVFDQRPFCMGARQSDDVSSASERRMCGDGAEDLRLLTAHDIRCTERVRAGDASGDGNRMSASIEAKQR